jgi:hypothetical protein
VFMDRETVADVKETVEGNGAVDDKETAGGLLEGFLGVDGADRVESEVKRW